MSELQGLLVAVVIGIFVGRLFFGGKGKRRSGGQGSRTGEPYYGDDSRGVDDRDDDADCGDDGDDGGDSGSDD